MYSPFVSLLPIKELRRSFLCVCFVDYSNKTVYKMYSFQQKLYYFQYINMYASGKKHALRKKACLPNRTSNSSYLSAPGTTQISYLYRQALN